MRRILIKRAVYRNGQEDEVMDLYQGIGFKTVETKESYPSIEIFNEKETVAIIRSWLSAEFADANMNMEGES